MTPSIALNTVGGATFAKCSVQNKPLFRINPGISCEEALEKASLLMDCVNKLTLLSGMDNDNDAMVWASHYLSEMAKAIIDDVTSGLQLAQGGGV
ncbi:DUF3077 domain-containing protein [Pseudomonas sp. B21-012]|uniref:DUF3077 domain-containing protein n=1 Tax=Pseudomonas sp. B21-012 TaxID=2895472 RepID=UPI00215F1CCF|nr:DUF3077 domain-containing protein [Pseudomonas sp. B21-012]UVM56843.1 DUF3077 domain-containing protein [Pseudomonas sp. B21-012]